MDEASREVSLLEHLDLQQLTCLNEEEGHTLKSIVASRTKNTSKNAYVVSDADEQLLLNFNQTVRVRSIVLQAADAAAAPRTIKLLINRPALGFEDVDGDADVAQTIELGAEQVRDGARVPLRYVRFQAVNSLHIFVETNQGGAEQTRIDAVDFFGFPVAGTRDLSGLRRTEE
ncbi:DUF1000-domain-containing protein [Amylocystis lapponica]|nr:DUF1000-domain-containing protein [Amylocystis lapponica]